VTNWTADGWLRTGDVVTNDAEGYVKIKDRSKDLIRFGGEWISSVDLENALIEHPKWVERPLAVAVLKPNI
jgi:fatty-acyl-CoA synthase